MRYITSKINLNDRNEILSTEDVDEVAFYNLVESEAIEDANKRGNNPAPSVINEYVSVIRTTLQKGTKVTIDDTIFQIEL